MFNEGTFKADTAGNKIREEGKEAIESEAAIQED